jgi:hypothetical protein
VTNSTAITFDELLDEFRALGGIAENVRRGLGPYGYGIFPVDPGRPVRLHASENILIPPADLEVRDGRLAVRAGSAVGERERRFFETLHEHFGWSTGGFEELWGAQVQWHGLPAEVAAFVTHMGAISDPNFRFAEPSANVCLYQFVKSRDISYKNQATIMPMIDLVNHSGSAPSYVMVEGEGIGVQGVFPGEVLVRYNVSDSWANTMTYGFADRSPFAYSLSLNVEIFGTQRLSILRNTGLGEVHDDRIHYPRKRVDGNTIELSFANLGNARQPDLPRAIFRKLLADHVTRQQADDVFESVVRFNHDKFVEALRLLRKHSAVPLVRALEDAAINQLDALAACVGARQL